MTAKNGNPVRIEALHFTTENFDCFDLARIGSSCGHADPVAGFYFTTNPHYNGHIPEGMESEFHMMRVALNLKNPFMGSNYASLDPWGEDGWEVRTKLEAAGYDAVILGAGDEIVAFYPEQIEIKK